MSTNINPNLLNNFIIKKVGSDLTMKEAQSLGVENQYYAAAEELDEVNIDINDFTEDLLSEFAVLYVEEQEKKTGAKDKEQEKEEQMAIKDKSNAGLNS